MSEELLYPESRRMLASTAGDVPVTTPGLDLDAHRARVRAEALREPRHPVAEVRDLEAGGVRCRLYVPDDPAPGVVLTVHGGGFVLHDVDVYDNTARRLADRSRLRVLAVEYRLAPEHVFPAAVEDVDSVVDWLASHAADEGLDGPAYAHGDSAGANLALVTALHHPGFFAALALTYPFLDPEGTSPSYDLERVGFDRAVGEWYWDRYVPASHDRADPDLAPARSDRLPTLPPTLVTTAEADPLRDEGESFARTLVEAGVEVVATRYLGQTHGFWRHASVFPAADRLTAQIADFLRSHS
jgi:acetyl esterase